MLARTQETIRLDGSLAGIITGRTSYARLGLSVELSQSLVQPGHRNPVPLQIVNHTPYAIVMYPGAAICQLTVTQLSSAAEVPYDKDERAKYADTTEMLSRIYRDDNVPSEVPGLRRAIDMDQLLNVTIIVFALVSLCTVGAVVVLDAPAADTARLALAPASLGLLLLTIVIRVVMLFRRR